MTLTLSLMTKGEIVSWRRRVTALGQASLWAAALLIFFVYIFAIKHLKKKKFTDHLSRTPTTESKARYVCVRSHWDQIADTKKISGKQHGSMEFLLHSLHLGIQDDEGNLSPSKLFTGIAMGFLYGSVLYPLCSVLQMILREREMNTAYHQLLKVLLDSSAAERSDQLFDFCARSTEWTGLLTDEVVDYLHRKLLEDDGAGMDRELLEEVLQKRLIENLHLRTYHRDVSESWWHVPYGKNGMYPHWVWPLLLSRDQIRDAARDIELRGRGTWKSDYPLAVFQKLLAIIHQERTEKLGLTIDNNTVDGQPTEKHGLEAVDLMV